MVDKIKHGVYTNIEARGRLEFGVWGTVPDSSQTNQMITLSRGDNTRRPLSETGDLYNDFGGLTSLQPVAENLIPGNFVIIPDTEIDRVLDYCHLDNAGIEALQPAAPATPLL